MSNVPTANAAEPDCRGCGVCCFHMGYPAFVRPSGPLTWEEIEADPRLREFAKDARTRQQLLDGNPGEVFWHRLPEHLRAELESFVANYSVRDRELAPPCFWLDMNTRRCKHHEHRPRVCRDFEIGSRGCREWRSHYHKQIVQLT